MGFTMYDLVTGDMITHPRIERKIYTKTYDANGIMQVNYIRSTFHTANVQYVTAQYWDRFDTKKDLRAKYDALVVICDKYIQDVTADHIIVINNVVFTIVEFSPRPERVYCELKVAKVDS